MNELYIIIAKDFICSGKVWLHEIGHPTRQTPTYNFWHSLVRAHIYILHISESVYDLLPKELQLPLASQDSLAMSQKSGGEAGPLPSAAVASGRLRSPLRSLPPSCLFCCPGKKKKVTHPIFSRLINLDLFPCRLLLIFVRLFNMHAIDLIFSSSVLLHLIFFISPLHPVMFLTLNLLTFPNSIFNIHLHTFSTTPPSHPSLFLFTGTCVLFCFSSVTRFSWLTPIKPLKCLKNFLLLLSASKSCFLVFAQTTFWHVPTKSKF